MSKNDFQVERAAIGAALAKLASKHLSDRDQLTAGDSFSVDLHVDARVGKSHVSVSAKGISVDVQPDKVQATSRLPEEEILASLLMFVPKARRAMALESIASNWEAAEGELTEVDHGMVEAVKVFRSRLRQGKPVQVRGNVRTDTGAVEVQVGQVVTGVVAAARAARKTRVRKAS